MIQNAENSIVLQDGQHCSLLLIEHILDTLRKYGQVLISVEEGRNKDLVPTLAQVIFQK